MKKSKSRVLDPNEEAYSVLQHVIQLTENMPQQKIQTGRILIKRPLKKGQHEVSFSLSPHRPIPRDIERVTFLATLAGDASAHVLNTSKEASLLWGSDKALEIAVRFL
jgi:hypothetical protein